MLRYLNQCHTDKNMIDKVQPFAINNNYISFKRWEGGDVEELCARTQNAAIHTLTNDCEHILR